ncbi:Zn-dependent alcohol dehydrogenase [Pseudorhodoferax sp.]|uniref:Zn-dependent alcohol dehydrogenase n=1 Tax=Pseudorhodoferax sp. TaxID=1993553 RepID=UPI002DD620B1|nr:Zn-dependent alcohol dehydrogenase [Pseudorhodoferax sp.]
MSAILRSYGGPVTVEEIEVDAPMDHEVLVRTVACGVCHSDLHFVRGAMPHFPVPAVLGHEAAGVVEQVGKAVQGLRPGDHVIACNSFSCGRCRQCLSGVPHLCMNRAPARRPRGAAPRLSQDGSKLLAFSDLGALSQYMLLPEQALVRIDKDIPLDRAALIGCAVLTGMGAALNTAKIAPGASVAVFGCGGIGSAILQGARIAGARRIIAIDVVATKLQAAIGFGATDVVNSHENDPVDAIMALTGEGVDVAFDAVGSTRLLSQCFAALAPRGTAVLVGAIPAGEQLAIDARGLLRERKLTGSFMGSNRFQLDMPYYLDLYRQGRLNLDAMVSERLPLDRIGEAFEAFEHGRGMRTVITFDQ